MKIKNYIKKSKLYTQHRQTIYNWYISFNWLWIRFFCAFPSKHFRVFCLNLYKDVNIDYSVPIYRGFSWRKGPMSIKEGTSIGINNMFDSRNGLNIGKNVCFSDNVTIWTMHHDYIDIHFATKGGAVIIQDFVWVGCNVIILPGVTIGEGAVIASGSVVTKSIDPYTVVGGIPAKKIAERKKQIYQYRPADFYIHMD